MRDRRSSAVPAPPATGWQLPALAVLVEVEQHQLELLGALQPDFVPEPSRRSLGSVINAFPLPGGREGRSQQCASRLQCGPFAGVPWAGAGGQSCAAQLPAVCCQPWGGIRLSSISGAPLRLCLLEPQSTEVPFPSCVRSDGCQPCCVPDLRVPSAPRQGAAMPLCLAAQTASGDVISCRVLWGPCTALSCAGLLLIAACET